MTRRNNSAPATKMPRTAAASRRLTAARIPRRMLVVVRSIAIGNP